MSRDIFEEIKELAEAMGGRYVIVENNQPKYVLMSFEEYRQLGEKVKITAKKDDFSKVNAELEELKMAYSSENNPDALIDFAEDSAGAAEKGKTGKSAELSDLPY